jgi:hypothetical protein
MRARKRRLQLGSEFLAQGDWIKVETRTVRSQTYGSGRRVASKALAPLRTWRTRLGARTRLIDTAMLFADR